MPIGRPSVAYDAKDNVWLINSLALTQNGSSILGAADLVNRSTDGGLTWGNPATIAAVSGNQNFDKNWIVCDSTLTSSFYGRCYAEFDDNGNGNALKMYYTKGKTLSLGPSPTGEGSKTLPVASARFRRIGRGERRGADAHLERRMSHSTHKVGTRHSKFGVYLSPADF